MTSVAPSVDSSLSVFDRVRDVISAWRKDLPDKLKNDEDIGQILLRIDNLQTAHEAILTDAKNMALLVEHVCQDMVYLVDDLEDGYGRTLSRSTERRLQEMARRVSSAETESETFERRFEGLCLKIVSDLVEIDILEDKFSAKVKTRKFQKDLGNGLALCGLALSIFLPVIGAGIAAVVADAAMFSAAAKVGLVAGGVLGLGGVSLSQYATLKLSTLADKQQLLRDVGRHLEMRKQSSSSMQKWWQTVKTDVADISINQDQVATYSLERLQQMRAVWEAMRQHMAVPPASLGDPFITRETSVTLAANRGRMNIIGYLDST